MLFEYRRELSGGAVLTTLDVDSELLRGNPLGDPSKRSQPVLLPPVGAAARSGSGDGANGSASGGGGAYIRAGNYAGLPIVTVLVGYTGFNHKVINKGSMWGDSVAERIAKGMASGAIPPAVFVWPAAETRLGGSQYVDSAGTGMYQSYVLDEVIPAVEAAFQCGGDGKRVVVGKSSGGFGALSLAMRRPAYFSAVGSHAGDMGFDMSHFRGFADALNCWAKYGGPEEFVRLLPELERFGNMEHAGIEGIAMASCYSPNPEAPLGADLPVDPVTGEIRHDVFEGWLKFDPLRMVDQPEFAQGLRDLKMLYLDAGETDEFALQWGLKRLQVKLTELEIPAHIEFCKGGHFTLDNRYAVSLPLLLGAI